MADSSSDNFFKLVIDLNTNINLLNQLLVGGEDDSVDIEGVTRPSIAKDIKDKYSVLISDISNQYSSLISDINSRWSAIQALVDSAIVFKTKAVMDVYVPTIDSNGNYPLAKVWGDTLENNGTYGYTGSIWEKSAYDLTSYVDKQIDIIAEASSSRSGYHFAVVDNDGRMIFAIDKELNIINGSLDAYKVETGETITKNKADILALLDQLRVYSDETRSGYSFAITDDAGKILLGIRDDGEIIGKFDSILAKIFQNNTEINQMSENISILSSKLDDFIDGQTAGPDLVCWGDSLTASTVGYPSQLAALTGLTVFNAGVGGETSNTILARSGAFPFQVRPVSDSEIPASGYIEITFDDVFGYAVKPLLQGVGGAPAPSNPADYPESAIVAIGFEGELNGVHGFIAVTHDEGLTNRKYWFVRQEAGEAVSINRPPYNYRTYFSEQRRGDVAIIWMGQNGNDDDTVFKHVELLIDHLSVSNRRFIIIPKPTSDDTLDQQFIDRWGKHVLCIRQYLCTPIYDTDGTTIISSYGLNDLGITPSAQDLTDISMGKVPESLTSDGLHFTADTHGILVNLINEKLKYLNYI